MSLFKPLLLKGMFTGSICRDFYYDTKQIGFTACALFEISSFVNVLKQCTDNVSFILISLIFLLVLYI